MALSKHNKTLDMDFTSIAYPVKASAVIYGGALVVTSTADGGFAKAGVTGENLRVLGVAQKSVTGGATDGAVSVVCDGPIGKSGGRRLHRFKNDSAPNALTQAMIGTDAYIKDDETFTADSTGRSVGGKLRKIDGSYVWIELAL